MWLSGSAGTSDATTWLLPAAVGEEVHDGHAHGDAVGDLLEDDGTGAVGEFGGQLDVAVDGAGVHDERVLRRGLEGGIVDTEEADIFADAGEEPLGLALELDAQRINHIRSLEGLAEIVGDAYAEALDAGRNERGRAAERDIRTELLETPDVAARNA